MPALLVSKREAAAMLSMSTDTLERHVIPCLRLVTVGRRVLVPVKELERWIDRSAALPLSADLERMRR